MRREKRSGKLNFTIINLCCSDCSVGHENRELFVKQARLSHVPNPLSVVVMTFKCNAHEGINGILIGTYVSKATNSRL